MSSAKPTRHICPPDHKHAEKTTCYFSHRCRCFACSLHGSQANAQLRRDHAAGQRRLVPIGPALEHVRRLQAAGIGPQRIAALAGLSPAVVSNLIYLPLVSANGQERRIRIDCEAKILSVPVDALLAKDGARIDGRGTARRLQALCALGWPGTWLAGMLGTTQANFSRMTQPQTGVTTSTARAVIDLYNRLAAQLPAPATPNQRGAVLRAKRHAARHGWAPPLAWDDIDHDSAPVTADHSRTDIDPIAVELAMSGEPVRLTTAERLQALRTLNANGKNDHQIAALLHIDVRSVIRIRADKGIPAAAGPDRSRIA